MEIPKQIIFVLGHPITSIGKGTFAAHVTKMLLSQGSAHIIKFDGVLNKDFRNLSQDEDIRSQILDDDSYGGYDFKTYKSICNDLTFTKTNLIMGSDLIVRFIESHADAQKALRFIPDLSQYVLDELARRWIELGKPQSLVVEIGGVLGDLENQYITHAIAQQRKSNQNVRVCVLTQCLYNEYDRETKTRLVQETIWKATGLGLVVDCFIIRSIERVSSDVLRKVAHNTGIDKEKLCVFHHVPPEDIITELKALDLDFLR